MPAYATAEELRRYLDVTEADLPDETADQALELVSGPILSYTNRTHVGFEMVEEDVVRVDGTGSEILLLPSFPVLDVVEVRDRLADEVLVDDVDFEWSEKGILRRLGGRWSTRARAYVVTYDHGFEEIPPAVKAVALRLAARMISNPEGLATESALGYAAGFAFDETRIPTVSRADERDLNPFRIES